MLAARSAPNEAIDGIATVRASVHQRFIGSPDGVYRTRRVMPVGPPIPTVCPGLIVNVMSRNTGAAGS
ncbi:MAG: hypothetical protein QOE41_2569 [Mycobacterium sp.]|jgi:hypothetical protein|nr:hypothetical protein [Mycobacterium sp.]MDT5133258.1 hypothetical protein [Mycobacterium sp.]